MVTYSTNWMGPINQKWVEEHGDCWSAGRIDIRDSSKEGYDDPQQIRHKRKPCDPRILPEHNDTHCNCRPKAENAIKRQFGFLQPKEDWRPKRVQCDLQ